MATIVTRSGKGSPLTNTEVDANFTNLNTDKLESGDLSVTTTAVGTAALSYDSGVFTYTPPDLSAIDLSLYAPLAGATFTGDVEAPEFIGSLRGNSIFKAKAGEALSKGDAIYISGISGNTPVVSLADANDAAKMPCFGLASGDATLNSTVDVVTYGAIKGLDTSGFTLGDTLYVSTTSGQLVNTAPSGETSLIQNIGKVERVHASAGILFIAGAGRTNATPNLDNGNFFLGNASNQSASADFDDSVVAALSGGSGISLSAAGVIDNTAPDQTVALTGAGATSISGTYPNFTISSVNTTYSAGTGISLSGTTFSLTDTNAKLNLSGGTLTGALSGTTATFTSDSNALTIRTASNGQGAKINFSDHASGSYAQNGSIRYVHADGSSYGSGNALIAESTEPTMTFLADGKLMFKEGIYLKPATGTGAGTRKDSNWDTAFGWGNHASAGYYAASNPNGYTNDQTAAEILTAIKTVDGSGSGLDADLLDGQQGSYYYSSANIPPKIKAGGTGPSTENLNTVANSVSVGQLEYRGFSSSSSNAPPVSDHANGVITVGQHNGNYNAQLAFSSNGNMYWRDNPSSSNGSWREVWDSGNDGSGSGLDADLLDGQQGSYYAPKTGAGASGTWPISINGNAATSTTSTMSAGRTDSTSYPILWGTTGSTSQLYSATAVKIRSSDGTIFATHYRGSGNVGGTGEASHHPAGIYSNGNNWLYGSIIMNNNAISGLTTINGGTPWQSGNDGSGSGLDADLLDGQHGSYYYPKSGGAITGATQITFSGNNYFEVNSTSTGEAMTRYNNTTSNLWYTGIRSTNQLVGNTGYHIFSAAHGQTSFGITSDGYVKGARAGTFWGSSNDGSGSGLDADLLDGQHGSYYANESARSSVPSKGNYNTTNSTSPASLGAGYLRHDFWNTFGGGGSAYRSVLSISSYTSGSQWTQLAFNYNAGVNAPIYFRQNQYNGTSWGSWNQLWDSANDGSGSGLDADLLDGHDGSTYIGKAGNSYYQHNTWIQGSGAYGLYNPATNNAHFLPNTSGSYGAWRTIGSRGGYSGIFQDTGAVTTGMYDSSGNGGEYRQSSGRWYTYHHVGNNCMGLNASTTSSAYGLYVTGAIYSTGNITAYSDRRVKENIRTIDNALETVEEMRGVYYNRIDDEEKKTVIGFIAQEVDEIEGAKPLVTYAEDVDQYGVSYGNTAALLVEAVKKLSQQVKYLQAEVKELKNG